MKTINIRGIICGSELDNEFTVSYIERGIITPLSVFEREIADSNGDDLTIYINSQGGSVDAGMEMLSKIQDYKGNITIVVGALAASMAAEIVLLAGKRVGVHENTRVMFHSAYGVVEGGPEALKDYAKELEIINKPAKEKLVALGVPKEEVEEGFSEGRMFWMGADDLLSYGIAQKVIDGAEAFDKPTDEEVKALAVQSARIAAYAFEPAQAEETAETAHAETVEETAQNETAAPEAQAEEGTAETAQTETEEPAQAQTAAPEAQAEEPAQTETAETVETAAPESASAQTEVPRISGLVEVEASLLERLRKSAEHSEENARKVQSAASKKIDTLNKILAELNEKMAAKDAEIEAAKLEKGSLENEINNFKQRLDSALADCDEKNNRIEALEKELGEKNLRVADLQTRVKDVIGNVCDSQEEECSDWLTALRRYGTAKALALYPDLAREFRAAMATRTKKN